MADTKLASSDKNVAHILKHKRVENYIKHMCKIFLHVALKENIFWVWYFKELVLQKIVPTFPLSFITINIGLGSSLKKNQNKYLGTPDNNLKF
jgi:hypothetical protein